MEDAFNTLRPLRRTNSLPGSLADPVASYEYPISLDDALHGPRQHFASYENKMRISPAVPAVAAAADKHNLNAGGTAAASITAAAGGENVSPPTQALHPTQTSPRAPTVCTATARAAVAISVMTGSMIKEDPRSGRRATAEGEQPQQQGSWSPEQRVNTDQASGEAEADEGLEDRQRQRRQRNESEVAGETDTNEDGEQVSAFPKLTATVAAGADEEDVAQAKDATDEEGGVTPPPLTATEECIPYDRARMQEWLVAYRDSRDHCPPGIARFLGSLPAARRGSHTRHDNSSADRAAAGLPAFGIRISPVPPASTGVGGGSSGSVTGGTSSLHSGRHALEALADIWENRKEMPIAVSGSLRRHGLFGNSERKELHQMVIAVLNKVTTDPTKFREVKNELLRLPIPEASPEQLDDVVAVFFNKAVHEPHFCHSYADLIAALCKVPEGQHITGDKKLSLEYRLRRALVSRCQKQFRTGNAEGAEDDADEQTRTERRHAMVGNVRFVSELYLRDIVSDVAVTVIFLTCCTGPDFGSFPMPPTHTPTEMQVDEVIAAVQATGERYFESKSGRELLPALTETLRYWTEHHPISRCRFILMSTVDTLQEYLHAQYSPPTATITDNAHPHLCINTHTHNNGSSGIAAAPPSVRGSQSLSPLSPTNDALGPTAGTGRSGSTVSITTEGRPGQPLTSLAPAAALNTSTGIAAAGSSAGSPKLTTTVGGKSLPVPRSQRVGPETSFTSGSDGTASPLAASVGAGTAVAAAEVASPHSPGPVMGRIAQSVVIPAAVAAAPPAALQQPQQPQQLQQQSSAVQAIRPALRQSVRTESVAKVTADFGSGAITADAVAEWMITTYGDVLAVLAVWFDRALSVVREEKTRLRTGELLAALVSRHVAERPEMRETAYAALQRAVEQDLHEDLKVFRFWAQCVLSDTARVVLDEDLLTDTMEYLYESRPDAMRGYLTDVSAWYSGALAGTAAGPVVVAADEATGFVRYRPLLRVYLMLAGNTGASPNTSSGYSNGNDGSEDMVRGALALLNFPDVRRASLEIDLFCALCAGTATVEAFFEKVRTSTRLAKDATLAAAVVSAVLLAELVSPSGRPFLEDYLAVLLVAVDGVNRAAREMAVVVEAQGLLACAADVTPTHAATARVFMKLRSFAVVSDETLSRAQRYFESIASFDEDGVAGEPQPSEQVEATQMYPVVQQQQQQRQQYPQPQQQLLSCPRPESLRSGSGQSSSNSSTPCGGHGSAGVRAKGSRGHWRSSNASLGGSGPRSPDTTAAGGGSSGQLHPSHNNNSSNSNDTPTGGPQRAAYTVAAAYRRGAGRTRYNRRSHESSNSESVAELSMVPHRVTGYQRATGLVAPARGRRTTKYSYQSSGGGGSGFYHAAGGGGGGDGAGGGSKK